MNSESIYDGPRLAQPDEVWNFQTGDGLEKAILLANVWRAHHPSNKTKLALKNGQVELSIDGKIFHFSSTKSIEATLSL